MKKIIPVAMILLGLAEIIIAVMDIKIPVIMTFAFGVLFLAWGIKILLDAHKKK